MISVVEHATPGAFLGRVRPFLEAREDHHNLMYGLLLAQAAAERWPADSFFGAVQVDGRVVGCVLYTPPHPVLLTALPPGTHGAVAAALAGRYGHISGFLGPEDHPEAVAGAWSAIRGGGVRQGMHQGLYRVDEVVSREDVPGLLRTAGPDDVDLATRWGEGFVRDTGIGFLVGRELVARWVESGGLHLWIDEGETVSMAVAHGRTPRGIRVGYVYTPPERRRRGYAAALVAALSRRLLASGLDFCVLYTDLANPTSNSVYKSVGYRMIGSVREIHVEEARGDAGMA